jgi:hypothetical protein
MNGIYFEQGVEAAKLVPIDSSKMISPYRKGTPEYQSWRDGYEWQMYKRKRAAIRLASAVDQNKG